MSDLGSSLAALPPIGLIRDGGWTMWWI